MTGTLVVGLDGATWTVVDPLLERGALPHLEAVLETGVRGTLTSTVPPMTPPAWASIATGVGPGTHGIYGFTEVDPDTYGTRTVDYDSLSRPAVWDVFDQYDRPIGVVNYPAARPPPAVDGFFVSGFPGSDDDPVAHPPAVESHLAERGYRVQPRRRPTDDPVAYFEEVKQLATERCGATIELYERHDVELLWPVFMATDWIQHYLWETDVEGRPAVEAIYEHLDGLIGRLLAAVGDDWNVVVLSDHGFRPVESEIHMNTVLEDGGYLCRTDTNTTGAAGLRDAALETAWSIGNALPFRLKEAAKRALPDTVLDRLRRSAGVGMAGIEDVDWPATAAYATGWMGRLYLHRAGVYADGTVTADETAQVRAQLRESLADLAHPDTGEPIFEHVRSGEDIYGPDAAGNPPDLLGTPRDWRYAVHGDFDEEWLTAPTKRVADHHPTGVCVVAADPVGADHIDASVTGVLALLSALHDLPVVEDADEDLRSQCGLDATAGYVSPDAVEQAATGITPDVYEGVEERLRDLGYR